MKILDIANVDHSSYGWHKRKEERDYNPIGHGKSSEDFSGWWRLEHVGSKGEGDVIQAGLGVLKRQCN